MNSNLLRFQDSEFCHWLLHCLEFCFQFCDFSFKLFVLAKKHGLFSFNVALFGLFLVSVTSCCFYILLFLPFFFVRNVGSRSLVLARASRCPLDHWSSFWSCNA